MKKKKNPKNEEGEIRSKFLTEPSYANSFFFYKLLYSYVLCKAMKKKNDGRRNNVNSFFFNKAIFHLLKKN